MALAGRNFDKEQTLEKQIKELFLNVTWGGATFTINSGYGTYSIVKSNTGDYKIELDDKWVALRGFDVCLIDSTARDFTFQIKSYDINPVSGKAYINFYSITGSSKTDIPTNSKLLIKMTLKNQNEQSRV